MQVISKTICEGILSLNSISCVSFSALYYIALYIPSWITPTRDHLPIHEGCRRLKICPEHQTQGNKEIPLPPKEKGNAEVAS